MSPPDSRELLKPSVSHGRRLMLVLTALNPLELLLRRRRLAAMLVPQGSQAAATTSSDPSLRPATTV
jgi:hypothetical protein